MSNNTTNSKGQCPRRQTKREILLHLNKSQLIQQMSYRGNHCNEILHAARDANATIRNHYKEFIFQVGRNIFPLIIASDHEEDGYSGIGSTLTLYREDGSIITQRPCLGTYYELYKTCSHFFMALAVEIGPYMSNKSVCCSQRNNSDEDDGSGNEKEQVKESNINLSRSSSENDADADAQEDNIPQPWEASMTELLTKAQILHQSILQAEEMETNKDSSSSQDNTKSALPPPEMVEIVTSMLKSIINFCQHSLTTRHLNLTHWTKLNQQSFPLIKKCMSEATNLQAKLCTRQIIDWKDNLLTSQEWDQAYVVIPTVWAVDKNNPRKEMFRQLLNPNRVDTHLITSEWPRTHGEVRTLLGRIVGDRAIGRMVFGDETEERRVKTMGLSSGVDVVMDDALPAICAALKELDIE